MDVFYGLVGWVNSLWLMNGIQDWFLSVLQTDIAKMTIAFTIAAQMHRRWVRKDVADQFNKITAAIDNVAVTVTKGLQLHNNRLEKVETGLVQMNMRVVALEQHETIRKGSSNG